MKIIRPVVVILLSIVGSSLSVADIASDISTANSRLSSAQSEGSTLRSALSSVKSEINRVNAEISTANSAAATARSEVSTFNSNAVSYNNQASTYRSQAAEFRDERDRQISRKAQLTSELGVLVDENYKLKNEIDAETIKKDSLEKLYDDIQHIADNVSAIRASYVDSIARNERALLAHEAWLNAFYSTTQEYKPLFSGITSADSFKEEMDKVYRFTGAVPALTNVRSEEASVHLLVDRLLDRIETIFNFTKKLPTERGIGYLSLSNKQDILNELILVDQSMSALFSEITAIKSSLYKRDYKRLYSIDFTIIAWTRLAEESLRSVNVIDATEIINSVSATHNDSIAYSSVRADLVSKQNNYRTNYRTYLSPVHARRGAKSTLQKARNVLESLESLNITYSTRAEIEAFILDHISSVDRDLVDINEDLEDRSFHHQRRIAFVEGMLSRYESRMTDTCIGLANELIDTATATTSHEKGFIEFKGGCLR